MKELKLTVEMHCKSCEKILREVLTEAGIDPLEISSNKNLVRLKYDETKIKESQIREIIEKEGYKLK